MTTSGRGVTVTGLSSSRRMRFSSSKRIPINMKSIDSLSRQTKTSKTKFNLNPGLLASWEIRVSKDDR
jgi:hypothetical protein